MNIDPDFALQSRLSFGRGARVAWIAIGGALSLGLGGASLSERSPFGLAQAGIYGWLAHHEYGSTPWRSLAARSVPIAVTAGAVALGSSVRADIASGYFMEATSYSLRGVIELLGAGLLAGVTLVLARRQWRVRH